MTSMKGFGYVWGAANRNKSININITAIQSHVQACIASTSLFDVHRCNAVLKSPGALIFNPKLGAAAQSNLSVCAASPSLQQAMVGYKSFGPGDPIVALLLHYRSLRYQPQTFKHLVISCRPGSGGVS